MALREERNEQNSQAWHAHFERERLDLSASVEAALMDDGRVLIPQWGEELDEQDDAQSVTGGTGVVPPRLSLQSKMLPAIQPEHVVTTTTDAYQATSSHVVEEVEQKSILSSHLLARLARRFTSSFTAVKLENSQEQASFASSAQSSNENMMEAYQSMPAGKQISVPLAHSDTPLVRVIDTVMPHDPVENETRAELQHRRSLKRNGKVRLQTTELPALSNASLSPQVEEQETGEALLRDTLNGQQGSRIIEESSVPVYGAFSPAVPVYSYGSGAFENEHSDVMIANALITASSVVLVTLTTNPGPVVVQYISLQPQVGFTVHLTAPVTMRTVFNYVILLGETPIANPTY